MFKVALTLRQVLRKKQFFLLQAEDLAENQQITIVRKNR